MLENGAGLYEVELWWRGKTLIGDIRPMCESLSWSMQVNGVYTISLKIDTVVFEKWCELLNEDPKSVLYPHNTDVRIKRNGKYVLGGIIVEANGSGDENRLTTDISVDGFLNLLDFRFISKNYSSASAESIAKNLIERTQSDVGDLGIKIGSTERNTQSRDRTYEDQNIKEAIVNLTKLVTPTFDFEFAADRTFNLYATLGGARDDVIIEYPAVSEDSYVDTSGDLIIPAVNYNPKLDGSDLSNHIIMKGEGVGEATLRTEVKDNGSITKYYARQKIVSQSSIKQLETLEQNGEAILNLRKELFNIPEVKINGQHWFDAGLKLGDRIRARQDISKLYELSGYYRAVKLSCSVGSEDQEDLTITLDDFMISKNNGEVQGQ